MRLILIVAFVAVFGQQAKPDYNGAWVVNSDKSAKAIKEGLPANARVTITVTEKDVTLVMQDQGLVCGFGKVPIQNDQMNGRALCSAKWDGDPSRPPNPSDPMIKTYAPFTEIRLGRAGTDLKVSNAIHLASGNEVKQAPAVYEKTR